MTDSVDPDLPMLPIIAAEAAIQTLEKKNALDSDIFSFHREDLYNMLRDISRMTAELAWDEGAAASELDVNPYLGTYWPDRND